MRRILRKHWRRFVLPVIFLTWVGLFHWRLAPSPTRFEFQTGAVRDDQVQESRALIWKGMVGVSDNGRRVDVLTRRLGDRKDILREWSTRTGKEVTPATWTEPRFQDLISLPQWYNRNLHQLTDPTGPGTLARDETVWARFLGRAARLRGMDPGEFRRRPVVNGADEYNGFPPGTSLSPNGRLFAYHTRLTVPTLVGGVRIDAACVEETATGRCVAVLPGATREVVLAPDGTTAVSAQHCGDEGPWLVLWDLTTSRTRARLTPWRLDDRYFCWFSVDGAYVFQHRSSGVTWWDTRSGEQRGKAPVWIGTTVLADSGRMVVTDSGGQTPDRRDNTRLQFHDAATGRRLREWRPGWRPGRSSIMFLLATPAAGPYMTMNQFWEPRPDAGVPPRPATPPPPPEPPDPTRDTGIVEMRPSGDDEPRNQVLLLDAVAGQEVARLPGEWSALSPNGQWLATIDKYGVVRTWALPLREPPPTPWAKILGYAALATLAVWAVLALARRLRRQGA